MDLLFFFFFIFFFFFFEKYWRKMWIFVVSSLWRNEMSFKRNSKDFWSSHQVQWKAMDCKTFQILPILFWTFEKKRFEHCHLFYSIEEKKIKKQKQIKFTFVIDRNRRVKRSMENDIHRSNKKSLKGKPIKSGSITFIFNKFSDIQIVFFQIQNQISDAVFVKLSIVIGSPRV